MKDRCLTDEEITAYVDGVAEPSVRKRIEEHISECGLCLHNIAELKQLVSPVHMGSDALPEPVLARAERLIEKHTGAGRDFDITTILRDGVCRILESTGNLLPPLGLAPVAVRRERRDRRGGPGPRLAKSLSGYLVTVELSARKDTIRPKLTLVEEMSSVRPDGIKAKLYSPGACETKYSRNGALTFSAVGRGFFRIDIDEIGSIGLEVK
jgi:hypothetical protein